MIMVGLDVVAFFVGLVFGSLMHTFRRPMKYFAPVFFLLGYLFLALPQLSIVNCELSIINCELSIIIGSAFIGIAVMPLLSAALYLGQFVSPLVVMPLSRMLFGTTDLTAPYKVGILLCLLFLLQVWATRHFQSLPPEKG